MAIFSSFSWSKTIVLIGYFDAFEGAVANNSEKVAKLLEKRSHSRDDYEIRLCRLNTVFDKSFRQFEDCLKNMTTTPELILGLGEANCKFKIETIVRNLDQNIRPDNEGNVRMNTPIIVGAQDEIGLNYPLAGMYCSLNKKERSQTQVSIDAGSFVCNNISYQMTNYYKDLKYGFIHVPAHYCKNLSTKTFATVIKLEKMIHAGLFGEKLSIPTTKEGLKKLEWESKDNFCENQFYKKLQMLKRNSPRKF